jgi:uncharacterized protein YjeT (DUF2065 family)
MSDLIVAIGMVLVIEGLIWALAPRAAVKVLQAAADMPEQTLRIIGACVVAAGVVIVWFVRG